MAPSIMRFAVAASVVAVVAACVLCTRDTPTSVIAKVAAPQPSERSRPHVLREEVSASARAPAVSVVTADVEPAVSALVEVLTHTGEPVAGAEVHYWPPRSDAARELDDRASEASGVEAALRSTGERVITDATGRVRIAADWCSSVWVRRGNASGETDLGRLDDTELDLVQIELRRDVSLRIQIVDTDGLPVAGLYARASGDGYSRTRGEINGREWIERLGPTDASGIAVLERALHALDLDDDVLDAAIKVRVTGQGRHMWSTFAQQRIPLSKSAAEMKAQLTVPGGGSIEVTATDLDGLPVELDIELEDDSGESFPRFEDEDSGRFLFRFLPLGRRFQIVGSETRKPPFVDEIRLDVVGPTSSNRLVHVPFSVPVRRWSFSGRIVDPDGNPLIQANVEHSWNLSSDRFTGWTDQEGLFDHCEPLGPPARTDIGQLTLRVEHPFSKDRTFVIERALTAGHTNLGDFVVEPLEEISLLARVEVRAAGKRVPNANASIVSSEGEASFTVPTTASQVDGGIELRGVAPSTPMLLGCSHPQFRSPPSVRIEPGQRVVVELLPKASLRIPLFAPDAPRGALRGELRLHDSEEWLSAKLQTRQHALCWPDLAPGAYQLRIWFDDRVILENPSIEIFAGANAWPTDGAAVDLRNAVSILRITTRSTEDDSFIVPELMLVEPGAQRIPDDARVFRGDWIPMSPQPRDVLVRASGHAPVRLSNLNADIALRLQRYPSVELRSSSGYVDFRVKVVVETLDDPLLRAFLNYRLGGSCGMPTFGEFAPGTILEFIVVREGIEGPPQRVVVTEEREQVVQLD